MKAEANGIKTDWPVGLKRTKQREQVFLVLENATKPLSAMEIYTQIEKADVPVWLSTIYRILDLLVEKSLVVKITVMDNEMAVYELNHNQHKHYAVCMGCHKIITMDNCPMENFVPELADNDFQVVGHKLEMYGYCSKCVIKK